jgi:Holliday junction resolvasome RuvABC endonuclease subunit
MRIIGIDPSSTYTGTAILDTPREVVDVDHWTRDKTKSHPDGFKSFFFYLALKIQKFEPHMAVIEMGAFRTAGPGGKGNTQALQAVSFYQAISALCCKLNGVVVIETRATSARKATLGNGALSKESVWEHFQKNEPELVKLFGRKDKGGLDRMDAYVLAVAGPTVAER